MILRTILGLLIVMSGCSGNQQTSKRGELIANDPDGNLWQKTGLQIETGINRGITPNDSLGITDFLIHTTTTITNDSTIPVQLRIALSEEYEFPVICNDNTYKVFLLPELPPDAGTLWDSITSGFDDFIDACMNNPYVLNKTLEPRESCEFTIGTLYPSPTKCGVIPNAVFSLDDKELYLTCENKMNQDTSTKPQSEIGLKIGYYYRNWFGTPPDSCFIIPCGQISYPES